MQTIIYFASMKSRINQFELRSQKDKKNPDPFGIGIVVMSGFEPPTHGFSVRCSTN
jgi:hypothetical protein